MLMGGMGWVQMGGEEENACLTSGSGRQPQRQVLALLFAAALRAAAQPGLVV